MEKKPENKSMNAAPENKGLDSHVAHCSLCRSFMSKNKKVYKIFRSVGIAKVILTYCSVQCREEGTKKWDKKMKALNSQA